MTGLYDQRKGRSSYYNKPQDGAEPDVLTTEICVDQRATEIKHTICQYIDIYVGLHNPNFFNFFFSFIFISWRLITLQYSSGFCHTLT